MLYSSSIETKKGGGIPLLSLFFSLAAFFGFSTTTTSTFLLSHFQGCFGALVVYEVEPLEGFLTDILVLRNASTNLMKLEIYKFSK